MDKKTLRKYYKEQRSVLTKENLQIIDARIAKLVSLHEEIKGKCWHVFLPIKRHHEINCQILIEQLWSHGCNVVISKSNFDDGSLSHFYYNRGTVLKENEWGIPEPVDATPCDVNALDVILIPLLAVDLQGYRVGYGKGFYDRFIRDCRPDALKVGLSQFAPIQRIDDRDQWDEKLDYLIYPEGVLKF